MAIVGDETHCALPRRRARLQRCFCVCPACARPLLLGSCPLAAARATLWVAFTALARAARAGLAAGVMIRRAPQGRERLKWPWLCHSQCRCAWLMVARIANMLVGGSA